MNRATHSSAVLITAHATQAPSLNGLPARASMASVLCACTAILLLGPATAAADNGARSRDRTAATNGQRSTIVAAPAYIREGAETTRPFEPTRFSGDLRDLPRATTWHPGDPVKSIPRRAGPRELPAEVPPANPVNLKRDPLLSVQENAAQHAQRAFTSPVLNISGQGFNGVLPPDTMGAIGENYYIQIVNAGSGASFVVYNKNGSAAVPPTLMDTLGSGQCANGAGDPVISYDTLAGRFVMLEFSSFGNRVCVYVSQVTGDPISGGWFAYEISAPGFPDYPKIGVWSDAYYVGSNEFPNPAVYAMDRTAMLNGAPATVQRFTIPALSGFGFQGLLPADLDGDLAPPTGTPGYFVRHRDDERHNAGSNNPSQDFIEIWEFDVDFATPANSSVSGPNNIAVAEFDSSLCGFTSFSCFDQPGGADLDPLREVMMHRMAYRNFGSHQALVGNLVTDVANNNQGGVRWLEFRDIGGGWFNHQEGTYAPDTHNRWMGSMAMDQSGNIALGYSVSSTTEFPDVRYTGRLATDALGTMSQPETTAANGSGSSTAERWGDYSAMTVDPVDDCTFWYTHEFANNTGTWNTQITAFRFDSCGQPAGICGDGLLDLGEFCDDANIEDGDGCSSACEIEDGFSCTLPVAPGGGGNSVADSGFAGGTPNASWTEASTNFGSPICSAGLCGGGDFSSDGDGWYVWFGGVEAFEAGSVEQTVTIPAVADTLLFDLRVLNCANPGDFTRALIDGVEVFTTDPCTPDPSMLTRSIDISAFADGGSHLLRFESVVNGPGNSSFFLDNVRINDPGTPGEPSICLAQCYGEDFDPPVAGNLSSLGFTVFNEGLIPLPWGTTDDGICASGSWALGNYTGGSGEAACVDSDAAGGPGEIVAYMCTPAIDLSTAGDPQLAFDYTYQIFDVPGPDDFFEVLVGATPPSVASVSGYDSVLLRTVSTGTFEGLPGATATVDLSPYVGESAVHVCYLYGGDFDWYAQVDDIEVTASACTGAVMDSDGDGVFDNADNCTATANADQTDTDGDGFGDLCDADFNQDCSVNFIDLGEMKGAFLSADPNIDMNNDGSVNFLDLGLFKGLFLEPPGPSGVPNLCD